MSGGSSSISYIYNANGVKVYKNVQINARQRTPIPQRDTDYLSGFQYHAGVLQFFPHAEGYVNVNAATYNYVYNYTDHLGNVRLSYRLDQNNVLNIIDENNYYPFGMKHEGYNNSSTAGSYKYKYKYNGKELQDELGLNMTAMENVILILQLDDL